MKTVAVSGYFDPIHVGHLEYLNLAKEHGDRLVVIVNNDLQCELKKGKAFMPEEDRVQIVEALEVVDEAFLSIDRDRSVCASLEAIKPDIFANGGDRQTEEVPETITCAKNEILMMDGLGDKIRSSSDLTGLKEIYPKEE
jgi:cytidyltransferase-like protein